MIGYSPLGDPACYREVGVTGALCSWLEGLPVDAAERIAAELPALRGA